jgi:hypothetical protein
VVQSQIELLLYSQENVTETKLHLRMKMHIDIYLAISYTVSVWIDHLAINAIFYFLVQQIKHFHTCYFWKFSYLSN